MAKISAKGAVITLDDSAGTPRTISGDVESYEIEYGYTPEIVTGFGEAENKTPGLLVTGVTLNLYWNTAATTGAWTVVRLILGSSTSKTLSITPEVGGPVFSGEFMADGVKISGSADGSPIKLGAVHFSVMGGVAPAWA